MSIAATVSAGLCRTCEHGPDCCYPRPGEGPRMQCEEFDAGAAPPPRPRRRQPAAEPQPGPAENQGPEPLGLCRNCRLRATCRHPRPEGGVWYCEEYEVG